MTAAHAPRVSVVVPTLDRPEALRACLAALAAQTLPGVEVIVVDDGSATPAAALAAEFPAVRFLAQPHRGASAARNLGAGHAAASILAFTDDDCRPEPDWLARATPRFADAEVVAVEGAAVSDVLTWAPTDVPMINHHGGKFATCNMLVRRDAFAAVGGFAADLPFLGEDRDLAFRLRRRGRIVFAADARVVHPVRRLSLAGFLRHHLRLRQTYWQVRFLEHSGSRVTWETAIFTPTLAAVAFAIARPSVASALLAATVYGGSALAHQLLLAKCRLTEALAAPGKLAGWVACWWFVALHDLAWRVAGIVRFRRVVL